MLIRAMINGAFPGRWPGCRRFVPDVSWRLAGRRNTRHGVLGKTCVLLVFCLFQASTSVMAVAGQQPYKGNALFAVYEQNRTSGQANLVTADLPLLAFALLRQGSLARSESEIIAPLFNDLVGTLSDTLVDAERVSAPATAYPEDVTLANIRYLSLLNALLDGDGSRLDDQAGIEYERVLAADSVAPSGLWGRTIDYTQFKPRGRYSDHPGQSRFFRAMRYAGSQFFAVVSSESTGISQSISERQTLQAMQLIELIQGSEKLRSQHQTLDDLMAWEFGVSRDFDAETWLRVWASSADTRIPSIQSRLLDYARKHDQQPSVIDTVVDIARLEDGLDSRDVVTGWRLLRSRESAFSAASQALVFPRVGRYLGPEVGAPFGLGFVGGVGVKAYPQANELLAMAGCADALPALDASHGRAFEGYEEGFTIAEQHIRSATGVEAELITIVEAACDSLPALRSFPSVSNTVLSFLTWNRYLTLLYSKQSYTAVSKGLELVRSREGADLEAANELYFVLGRAARKMSEKARGFGDHKSAGQWHDYAQNIDLLLQIGFQRARGSALDDDQEYFLNEFDSIIRGGSLTDTPIIVDVHNSPDPGMVVEHATAYPEITTVGGARGGYLTFNEFLQPMDQRMTLQEWHQRLADVEKDPLAGDQQ